MHSVRKIAEEIVAREGGYVNDPDDPGGATNFGVTIHTMRRLGLDLSKDGQITAQDVKLLTKSHAVDIFVDHYFKAPKLHLLPALLQPSVFDMYVNAGSNAVKILQRMINEMGVALRVDGALGPLTLKAAHAFSKSDPELFVDAYGIARRNYYYRIGDRRPASRKYARTRRGGKGGWITRAEGFISPKFHLSAREHSERVSAWA
ncbi:MAG: holin-associated N-acetylmuramidase [Pseudomonadota bacterium]